MLSDVQIVQGDEFGQTAISHSPALAIKNLTTEFTLFDMEGLI